MKTTQRRIFTLMLTVLLLVASVTAIVPTASAKTIKYYPACSSSCSSLIAGLKDIDVDSSYSNRTKIAKVNGITNYSGTATQNTKLLNLLKDGLLIKSINTSPNGYYSGYTTVKSLKNTSGCTSMQGLAVGSTYLYSVKIKTDNKSATIFKTHKDTGKTTQLTNSATGGYTFSYLGHANDMDCVTLNDKTNLFIATMTEGSNSLVRLQVSGSTLTKKGAYTLKYNDENISVTSVAILSKTSTHVNMLFKKGKTFYTGSVKISAGSGTINLTKAFKIRVDNVQIKGKTYDMSSWTHQGMGYHDGKLYVPLYNDSNTCQSVILVYNIENASGKLTANPDLSFRITSGTFSIFEIESCGICPKDGKLYFNTNRWKGSDANYDAVHVINDYVY